MKKYYILNIKSYILVTLYIVSFIIIVGEKTQNIIIKIIGFIYFLLFTYVNFIRKQNI